MNATSFLMMLMLFAPVAALVAMNLCMYRLPRYVRQPALMAMAARDRFPEALVVMELPAEAVALQKAYELRKAA